MCPSWRSQSFFGLLLLLPHTAGAEQLTAHQKRQLSAGEVITKYWMIKGTDIGTGKAAGVINATPLQVMKVVADVVRYKEYIQRMTESRITRRDDKTYNFFYRINMPWPLDDYWCETKNWHSIDHQRKIYRRSWRMIRGNFRRNEGYWLVQPWEGGRALVIYSVKLQIKSSLPQSVLNYITKKALPRSVSNLRKRVLALKKRGAPQI